MYRRTNEFVFTDMPDIKKVDLDINPPLKADEKAFVINMVSSSATK